MSIGYGDTRLEILFSGITLRGCMVSADNRGIGVKEIISAGCWRRTVTYGTIGKALPWIVGKCEGKPMKQKSVLRFLGFQSDNPKSAIQNPKWLGCLAILLLLTGWVRMAGAQQPGKVFRIGYLDGSTAAGTASLVKAFLEELSKLGWIEGKNIAIEYRFTEGKSERRLELAADLVRLKVDLIVVTGSQVALAAKKATGAIPILMVTPGDPVGEGLVASLARPGGNVTGFSSLTELNTKRLEILKDAVPKLSRVGLLLSLLGEAAGEKASN
jgi:hypothetical protein